MTFLHPPMKDGRQTPNIKLGEGSNIRKPGEHPERGVGMLKDWIADDDLWEIRQAGQGDSHLGPAPGLDGKALKV